MKSLKLHDALTAKLYQLERDSNIDPILRILNDNKTSQLSRIQIAAWIETYTPFVFSTLANGIINARKGKKKRPWRTADAQKNPYWQMEDRDPSVQQPKIKQQLQLSRNAELSGKLLKEALNNYLRNPTQSDMDEIVIQLKEYLQYGMTNKSSEVVNNNPTHYLRFISGGLPSLGKRAK